MIKSNKGISLVSLIIVIAVMLIITSVTISISYDRFEINNLNKLKNDLELLEDKVSNYYLKYNVIPVLRKKDDNTIIKYDETTLNFNKDVRDNGNYYIIDLEAMDGISLNYGKEGFENPNTSDDVYIINEKSHQIYYVRGIELDGEFYHSILDNNEISVTNDIIPPTKPEIKMVSGETNEQGVYTSAVSIEFVSGKDNGSGIAKTTYAINDEPEELTSTLPNNTLTISDNGTYNIKARSYDMANNVSDKTEIDITIKDASKFFITKWNVRDKDTGDTTVVLPIKYASTYDAIIHWGDGTSTPVQWQGKTKLEDGDLDILTSMVTHNYGEIEENENAFRTIEIEGTYPEFDMHYSTITTTKLKLTQIEQWGNVNFKNINFSGSKNLISPIPESSEDSFENVTSMSRLFFGCTNLGGEIPERLFKNCHNVLDLTGAFEGTNLSGSIPPKLFEECENVQNLNSVFYNCKNVTGNIPEELFSYCKKVTNVMNFFYGTGVTGNIPENLFANCTELTNVAGVFFYCSGITGEIPERLFANCSKITSFESTFRNSGITGEIPENLFSSCSEATSMKTTFEHTKVTRIPLNLFEKCNKITNFGSTFYGCNMLTGDAPELWKRDNVTTFNNCFSGCKNLSNYNEIPSSWGGGGE